MSERGRLPRIGFLGVGVSNLALLRSLGDIGCEVSIRGEGGIDRSAIPDGLSVERILEGSKALSEIDEDILFLSPSARRDRPALLAAAERGVRLMSDCELFFLCNRAPVFGVTGSDGKSTATTLASLLLSESFERVGLVGNIGVPFAAALGCDAYAAELSSFQLSYISPRLESALITSVSENHLNWHKSYDEYKSAKLRILENAERTVLSADCETCRVVLKDTGAYAVYSHAMSYSELRSRFSAEHYLSYDGNEIFIDGESVLRTDECRRREWYNIDNLMGAIGLCFPYFTRAHLASVAATFTGLAHRAELFYSSRGVDYINSSIDTSPSRTRATLTALDRRVHLILGGRGKGLSLSVCKDEFLKYAISLSLYGEAGIEYRDELVTLGIAEAVGCEYCERFDGAVERAVSLARSGDAVLLSPAATGYGEFSNYAERGEYFKRCIKERC